jgi:hypothetical protein
MVKKIKMEEISVIFRHLRFLTLLSFFSLGDKKDVSFMRCNRHFRGSND